jgi:outer membrane lipoprotein-sorting protein
MSTQSTRFLAVLSLAIGLCACSAHAQDLSASDLLKKIAETYRQVSSFSVVAEKKVDLDTDTTGSREGPAHMSDDIQVTLMASSSSKAKLLLKDGKKEIVAVTNGKLVWTLIPAQHAYEESTVVSVQTPFLLHRIGSMPILGSDLLRQYEILLAARYKDLSTYERWAKLERSENVKVGKDSRECYVVTIQMPGGDQMPGGAQKQKLWVDKTAFTIWKSVETGTSVDTDLSGTFDRGVSLQTTVTVKVEQIVLNPSLDDSNFVFTPPDKAKRVSSLELSGRNPF